MRIGDAAAAAGTTPRALRLYEQRGLLPAPDRSSSGQRVYGETDVARVRVIRGLLALGLTLGDLRGHAEAVDLLLADPARRCGANPSGGPIVRHRLAALDAEIARLTRLRTALALAAERPSET
ncbi:MULTISPECIES: MerR family transcriptional regulator [Kitasatospora]|uniref:Putative MerR family transcriptional regulator n=1 Tax=Kitasatospora setae (strain ATCC 33774 / DSM 43861 / JCM 3304 / KCC A-0304 / NBRC 14216 / KM-6054) TaxID=452652 RepID=E4N925_KITSK|nr:MULTISPECIES: MerR family transcriptional regulator [Kitasatospora]BAJ27706.1 putative MerR family transcriptional regulator [Kitasatospora setae KM-6054]